LGKQERRSFRCQNEVMCGGQEIWSKVEYNRMIRNRVEHIGKMKDVDPVGHVIGVPEIESVVRCRRAGESRM
jgi:hypothetical protein